MRTAVLITNPKAGRGAPEQQSEAVRCFCRLLEARGMHVEVKCTAGPNDATRLAVEAAREGVRDVIVAGGDGTINEALQGLVGTGTRLAIWPRGTANVLGRELRLPSELKRLAEIVAGGNVQRIYPGCAEIERTGERRYFLLMAGIGVDAAIVDRVRPAIEGLLEDGVRGSHRALVNKAVRLNIRASAGHLRHGSEVLERLIAKDGLLVVGAEYSLDTGVVDFFDGVPEKRAPRSTPRK